VSLSSAQARWIGENAGDEAGWAVAAGDADGDGVDDVLVGAFGERSAGSNAGAAYLVLGPASGTTDLSAADAKLLGENASDYAGYSVVMGDVDGDGSDDLLVGATLHSEGGTRGGIAYLVLGPVHGTRSLYEADARFIGEAANDRAGESVAVGDIDGDGIEDVLVGAPLGDTAGSDAGAVYLVHGPASGRVDLADADTRFTGVDADDWAGASVAAGDVNGDGIKDILVGARQADPDGTAVGAAYLVYGVGL
jgi:hypothetical protein